MKDKIVLVTSVLMMAVGMVLMIATSVNAQEYKLSKSSGKLVINEVNNVEIEGASGNEIIFSSLDGSGEKDKRAEGLRAISNMGLEDNTGIGLAVVDKGATVEVYQLKKMEGPKVKIQVPKGVIISYTHTSPYGNKVTFRNVESEIEVSTVYSGVRLENVTGPMTVKTVHGTVESDFSSTIKSPISIISAHGLLDITLPQATKATLDMGAKYGEIYVDPAFKIEFDKGKDEKWVTYSSDKVTGKINGGGLDITLNTTHGNIYLRKK